ncbi:unnamed protein product [Amoebophrya sp. A120]|nr:unnamed protein product [Amoebophrya sp. A120]|eukprot:GSA120T00008341001.1
MSAKLDELGNYRPVPVPEEVKGLVSPASEPVPAVASTMGLIHGHRSNTLEDRLNVSDLMRQYQDNSAYMSSGAAQPSSSSSTSPSGMTSHTKHVDVRTIPVNLSTIPATFAAAPALVAAMAGTTSSSSASKTKSKTNFFSPEKSQTTYAARGVDHVEHRSDRGELQERQTEKQEAETMGRDESSSKRPGRSVMSGRGDEIHQQEEDLAAPSSSATSSTNRGGQGEAPACSCTGSSTSATSNALGETRTRGMGINKQTEAVDGTTENNPLEDEMILNNHENNINKSPSTTSSLATTEHSSARNFGSSSQSNLMPGAGYSNRSSPTGSTAHDCVSTAALHLSSGLESSPTELLMSTSTPSSSRGGTGINIMGASTTSNENEEENEIKTALGETRNTRPDPEDHASCNQEEQQQQQKQNHLVRNGTSSRGSFRTTEEKVLELPSNATSPHDDVDSLVDHETRPLSGAPRRRGGQAQPETAAVDAASSAPGSSSHDFSSGMKLREKGTDDVTSGALVHGKELLDRYDSAFAGAPASTSSSSSSSAVRDEEQLHPDLPSSSRTSSCLREVEGEPCGSTSTSDIKTHYTEKLQLPIGKNATTTSRRGKRGSGSRKIMDLSPSTCRGSLHLQALAEAGQNHLSRRQGSVHHDAVEHQELQVAQRINIDPAASPSRPLLGGDGTGRSSTGSTCGNSYCNSSNGSSGGQRTSNPNNSVKALRKREQLHNAKKMRKKVKIPVVPGLLSSYGSGHHSSGTTRTHVGNSKNGGGAGAGAVPVPHHAYSTFPGRSSSSSFQNSRRAAPAVELQNSSSTTLAPVAPSCSFWTTLLTMSTRAAAAQAGNKAPGGGAPSCASDAGVALPSGHADAERHTSSNTTRTLSVNKEVPGMKMNKHIVMSANSLQHVTDHYDNVNSTSAAGGEQGQPRHDFPSAQDRSCFGTDSGFQNCFWSQDMSSWECLLKSVVPATAGGGSQPRGNRK